MYPHSIKGYIGRYMYLENESKGEIMYVPKLVSTWYGELAMETAVANNNNSTDIMLVIPTQ